MLTLIAETGFWDLLPQKASTFADWVDPLYHFELWLSLVCFVGIGGCMVYFAWKYRRRSMEDHPHGSHHNNTLEIVWSVIPLIIVLVIFVWGFRGFMDMTTPKAYGEEVVVTGSRWNWSFQYANGGQLSMEDGLYVPIDTPVRIVLKAPLDDVLHSFYIPAFRTKKDVVPGRYNVMWFEATELGTYDIFCAEYCGQQHSQMRSKVHVVTQDEYYAKLTELIRFMDNDPPAVAGGKVFKIKGCSTCHSTEPNVVITGPSLRDLFGKQETLVGGATVLADENYIMESVHNPSAKIVNGFKDQMTVLPVSDREMEVLIAYLKSISANYTGNRDELMAEPKPKE